MVKNPSAKGDTGDGDFIPGSERSPGGRNGNSLQYSCLENPMSSGAWRATAHGLSRVITCGEVVLKRRVQARSVDGKAETHTGKVTCPKVCVGDPRTNEQIKPRSVLECKNRKTRPLWSFPLHTVTIN